MAESYKVDGRKITLREIARRMGQLPNLNGVVTAAVDRFSARTGFVSATGPILQLHWATFTRISDGAAALLDWLCAKGGAGFKYDILAGTDLGADESE